MFFSCRRDVLFFNTDDEANLLLHRMMPEAQEAGRVHNLQDEEKGGKTLTPGS